MGGEPDTTILQCPRSPIVAFADYAAYLTAVFLATTAAGFATARFAAHRFFNAATMAARPAALSFRLRLGGCGVAGSDVPLIAAHLLRCASAIRFRPAALI